ncbi:TPA: RadC family protein [Vibrio diabolicus]
MTSANHYFVETPMTANQVLEKAAEIVASRYQRGETFTQSQTTKDYLQFKLGGYEREVFAVLFLDNQHRLIKYEEVFFGTINAANVYPREIVKLALHHNAAAVIFAHNHPSGLPEPSDADRHITQRLQETMALIDVRVLDHFVVGEFCLSFAEKGYL